MKEFKASTKKQVKVVLDDKDYLVRLPRVEDQVKLNKMLDGLADNSPDHINALVDWLDGLGLPKEATLSMYQVDLSSFIEDYLLEAKKK